MRMGKRERYQKLFSEDNVVADYQIKKLMGSVNDQIAQNSPIL